jgi:2-polyprenyl-3-methyl-5-hydroxy-6-metoxy-1,4-benzoquinol methylase
VADDALAQRQHASWDPNAAAWTDAVRTGAIASRRRGTDAAIVAACAVRPGERVLDVGCGEGWLARALTSAGAHVLGVDGSAGLVEAARAAGGAEYAVVPYAALVADARAAEGPFGLIVCNFALLDEDLAPLLSALARRLAASGRLVIQTVHPFVAAGDAGYVEGWREETFAGFGAGFSAPMPWYFRRVSSWVSALQASGLELKDLQEPTAEDGGVLSLLLEARLLSSDVAN